MNQKESDSLNKTALLLPDKQTVHNTNTHFDRRRSIISGATGNRSIDWSSIPKSFDYDVSILRLLVDERFPLARQRQQKTEQPYAAGQQNNVDWSINWMIVAATTTISTTTITETTTKESDSAFPVNSSYYNYDDERFPLVARQIKPYVPNRF